MGIIECEEPGALDYFNEVIDGCTNEPAPKCPLLGIYVINPWPQVARHAMSQVLAGLPPSWAFRVDDDDGVIDLDRAPKSDPVPDHPVWVLYVQDDGLYCLVEYYEASDNNKNEQEYVNNGGYFRGRSVYGVGLFKTDHPLEKVAAALKSRLVGCFGDAEVKKAERKREGEERASRYFGCSVEQLTAIKERYGELRKIVLQSREDRAAAERYVAGSDALVVEAFNQLDEECVVALRMCDGSTHLEGSLMSHKKDMLRMRGTLQLPLQGTPVFDPNDHE